MGCDICSEKEEVKSFQKATVFWLEQKLQKSDSRWLMWMYLGSKGWGKNRGRRGDE